MKFQADGKLIVGGQFTLFAGDGSSDAVAHGHLARVTRTGLVDTTFKAETNGDVNAVAVQTDGKVVVGGVFTQVTNVSLGTYVDRNFIARFTSTGDLDTTFLPTVRHSWSNVGQVYAVAVQEDGKVLVGGLFDRVKGTESGAVETECKNLVRFNADGSLDKTFNVQTDDLVTTIAIQGDGQILIGGGFESVTASGTKTTRERVARVSRTGVLDTTFDPCADDVVNVIHVLADGKIMVGGRFTTLQPNGISNTVGFKHLARLFTDGNPDYSFQAYPDNTVLSIAETKDGKIAVGGRFNGISSTGSTDLIYAQYIGVIGPDGQVDSQYKAAAGYYVTSLLPQEDGKLIAGGLFTKMNTGSPSSAPDAAYLARLHPDGSLDAALTPGPASLTFTASARQTDGKTIVAGSFTSLAGFSTENIARINTDGSVDSSFSCKITGPVYSIVLQSDGKIIIAGGVTEVNDTTVKYVARLNTDGSLDTTFTGKLDGVVYAMALQTDGKLVVGGSFTAANNVSRNYIARFAADGTLDTGFDPNLNSYPSTIKLLSDGKFLIGGSFTRLQPNGATSATSISYVARINSDGTYDKTFEFQTNAAVYYIDQQSDGKFILGGAFTLVLPTGSSTTVTRTYLLRLNSDFSLDTDYAPTLNGSISYARIQADNKLLISGTFTTVSNVARHGAARLNTDGSLETGFDPNTNGTITSFSLLSDGSFLALGRFTSMRPSWAQFPVTRGGIAHFKTDGSLDTSFELSSPTDGGGTIYASISTQDNSVIVAGSFGGFAGGTGANMARLDSSGQTDQAFNVDTDGRVLSILEVPQKSNMIPYANRFGWYRNTGELLVSNSFDFKGSIGTVNCITPMADGSVLVGGQFTIATSSVTIQNLAKIRADGTVDTSFAPQPNDTVNTIVSDGKGAYLVGGGFTNINGSGIPYFARVLADGTLDENFMLGFGGPVYSILVQSDGKIICGGGFTTVLTHAVSITHNYIVRINTDLTIDSSFYPSLDGTVSTMALDTDGRITIGGSFTTITPLNSTTSYTRNYFARLNSDGTLDTTFDPNFTGPVTSQAVQIDGKIVVGGSFTSEKPNSTANVTLQPYIARINKDGYIDATFTPMINSVVNKVVLDDKENILVGGSFTKVNGVQLPYIARLKNDGTTDTSFHPGSNSTIYAICVMPGKDGNIVLGGEFSQLDRGNILLIGGEFKNVGDTAQPYLSLLGTLGSSMTSFSPVLDGSVNAMVRQGDTSAVLGGAFKTVGGKAHQGLARINVVTGEVDSTFTLETNGPVYALSLQPDGKILVGGDFTTIGGSAIKGLARINTDLTIDTSFNPGISGGKVAAISVGANGWIYVGGSYTTIAGSGNKYFARLLSSGAIDSTFTPAVDGPVYAITSSVGGRVAIGGSFSKVGTSTCTNFAVLSSTGVVQDDTSVGANKPVYSLNTNYDGRILVAGAFTRFNGKSQYLLTRYADGAPANQSLTTSSTHDTLVWTRSDSSPLVNSVTFEYSSDGATWSTLGTPTASADGTTWTMSNLTPFEVGHYAYIRIRGFNLTTQNGSSGIFQTIRSLYVDSLPKLPESGSYIIATVGSQVTYSASGAQGSYRYSSPNLPAGFTIDPYTGEISGKATAEGTTQITVNYTDGSTSGSYTLILVAVTSTGGDGSTSTQNLFAYATRATTSSSHPLIIGFQVKGSQAMPVLIRALGPTLAASNIEDTIATPRGILYNSSGSVVLDINKLIDTNGNLTSETARIGASPLVANAKDAAAIVTLAPGFYTFVVTDINGAEGTVLAELYDANASGATSVSHIAACSSRGYLKSASDTLIGGYILEGTPASRALLRAMGPSLPSYVTDPIVDPEISLYSGSTRLALNNDWFTQTAINSSWLPSTGAELQAGAVSLTGQAMTEGSKDSALYLFIPAGPYTMVVQNKDGLPGTALIDLYLR